MTREGANVVDTITREGRDEKMRVISWAEATRETRGMIASVTGTRARRRMIQPPGQVIPGEALENRLRSDRMHERRRPVPTTR